MIDGQETKIVEDFVKRAYEIGYNQALADFGVIKTSEEGNAPDQPVQEGKGDNNPLKAPVKG